MITKVPILLYHGVAESSCAQTQPFTVTPETFERHMDAVVERGYRCLTVSEFIDYRHSVVGEHDDKIALITFDDGYADFLEHAVPVLQARNLSSTMYITTGWMDGGPEAPLSRPDDPMMTWKHVAELPKLNVEVGSHSHSHPHMDTLGRSAAKYELSKSKELLEDAVGAPIRSFAYPHGYSHRRLRRQVKAAGYDSATAVRSASSHVNDDAFRLARLMVFDTTTFDTIEEWLDGTNVPLAPRIEHPKTTKWRIQRRAQSIIERRPRTDYA